MYHRLDLCHMSSFIEGFRRITGIGDTGEDIEKMSKDLGLENPGLSKKEWSKLVKAASGDLNILSDLRQRVADWKVRQTMAESAGGREAYIKMETEKAEALRQRLEREKAVEKSEIQLKQQKQMADLARQKDELERQKKIDETLQDIEATFAADAARKQADEERKQRRGLEGI